MSKVEYTHVLKDFAEEIRNSLPENTDAVIAKYNDILNIYYNSSSDDVMLAEDFIKSCKSGFLGRDDGYGFFFNVETMKVVELIDFDVENMERLAEKYKYVVWYNK